MHMERESCSENIVSQKSVLLQNCDRMFQSCYRLRILRTYINISMLCSYCVSCKHHTFDQPIRITFHYGTIHECSRVTLITVTYYIMNRICLTGYLNPFLTCREATASTSADTGFINLIDNQIRIHLKHCFLQSLETAACYVLIQRFCVKFTTVFQNDSCLFCDKRNIFRSTAYFAAFLIKQSLDCFIALNTLLKNLLAVFDLNLCILDHIVTLLDTNQRSKFTDTLTSCFLHTYVCVFVMRSELNCYSRGILGDLHEFLIDFLGTGRNTSGT